ALPRHRWCRPSGHTWRTPPGCLKPRTRSTRASTTMASSSEPQRHVRVAALVVLTLSAGCKPAPSPPLPSSLTHALTACARAVRTQRSWSANQELSTIARELASYRASAKLSPQRAADLERLASEASQLAATQLDGARLEKAWNGFFSRLALAVKGD